MSLYKLEVKFGYVKPETREVFDKKGRLICWEHRSIHFDQYHNIEKVTEWERGLIELRYPDDDRKSWWEFWK